MKNFKLSLLDIGARDGIQWPFTSFQKNEIKLFLVEPDKEEAKKLKQTYNSDNIRVLPYALWSSDKVLKLNLTKSRGASSVYESNIDFLNQFPESSRFDIEKKINIEATTIDNLSLSKEIDSIDFTKIDTQGAELDILKGGKDFFMKNILGLEVEIEFCELYKNQPLFGDVDRFVREELGLELWDINKSNWNFKAAHKKTKSGKGKVIFGDALYFRPINNLKPWLRNLDKEKATYKLASLLNIVIAYGYVDYAYTILNDNELKNYLTEKEKKYFKNKIQSFNRGILINSKYFSLLYWFFLTLSNFFKPSYNGWANRNERQLGTYKIGPFYFY